MPRFDPDELHAIARAAVDQPHAAAVDGIVDALDAKYPGAIHRDAPWLFNNAGGAMGCFKLLHASLGEYIILFGTPIGTEGHSGRYRAAVWDFVFDGEMWCYTDADRERRVFRPGDAAFLDGGAAKGYRIPERAWMLEYARGPIPLMLPFGLADTLVSTLDHRTALATLWHYGRFVVRSLISRRPPPSPAPRR